MLPYRKQFPSGSAYYETGLQELGHWRGNPSRLHRATLMKEIADGFASPHYARGKLRAKISSMMTGDRPVAARRPRRLVDKSSERRPARDLPCHARRTGDA